MIVEIYVTTWLKINTTMDLWLGLYLKISVRYLDPSEK